MPVSFLLMLNTWYLKVDVLIDNQSISPYRQETEHENLAKDINIKVYSTNFI